MNNYHAQICNEHNVLIKEEEKPHNVSLHWAATYTFN